jgi:hypothetical protein
MNTHKNLTSLQATDRVITFKANYNMQILHDLLNNRMLIMKTTLFLHGYAPG